MGHRLRDRAGTRPRPHLARAGRRRGARRGAPPALRRAESGRARAARVLGERARPRRTEGVEPHREPVPRRVRAGGVRQGAGGDRAGRQPARRARGPRNDSRPRPTPSSPPTIGGCSTRSSRGASTSRAPRPSPRSWCSTTRCCARWPVSARRATASCSRSRASGPTKLERYGAAVLEIVGPPHGVVHRLNGTSFTRPGGTGITPARSTVARRASFRRVDGADRTTLLRLRDRPAAHGPGAAGPAADARRAQRRGRPDHHRPPAGSRDGARAGSATRSPRRASRPTARRSSRSCRARRRRRASSSTS